MPGAMLLLAAQAASAEVDPVDYTLPPQPRSERIVADCRSDVAAGEIVVCGRRDAHRYREAAPPKGVETGGSSVIGTYVGGARVEPLLEQVQMPNGMISKRVMVTVKVAF